jgi:hypothetical protein
LHHSDFVTIVTGVQRSGTSLMMRLLEAAGMPVLTDNVRLPDADNPNGYYEFEAVKQVRQDPRWVPRARGCAVKMVYRLLHEMPREFDYRVIFMRRDLQEIVRSQTSMLKHHESALATQDEARIIMLFSNEIIRFEQWVAQQRNFRTLYISFRGVVYTPEEVLPQVGRFLDLEIDIPKP